MHGLSIDSLHKKGEALACGGFGNSLGKPIANLATSKEPSTAQGLSARTAPLIRQAQIHHSCPVHRYTPTESFFECTASQGARKQGGPATQTDSVASLLLVKSTYQLRCSLARTRASCTSSCFWPSAITHGLATWRARDLGLGGAGGGARQAGRPFRSIRAGPFPPWLGRRLLAGLHGPFSAIERVHALVAERCLAEVSGAASPSAVFSVVFSSAGYSDMVLPPCHP